MREKVSNSYERRVEAGTDFYYLDASNDQKAYGNV